MEKAYKNPQQHSTNTSYIPSNKKSANNNLQKNEDSIQSEGQEYGIWGTDIFDNEHLSMFSDDLHQHFVSPRFPQKTEQPKHGVTKEKMEVIYITKNRRENKRKKSIIIPAETEVSLIKNPNETLNTTATLNDGKTYTFLTDPIDINITPNNLYQLPNKVANPMIIGTTGTDQSLISIKDVNIHYNGAPESIQSKLEAKVKVLLKSGNMLGTPGKPPCSHSNKVENAEKTITQKISFAKNETGDTDYDGKKFIFRFTRFNNGNSKHIILVEQLGEYRKKTLDAAEKEYILNKLRNYNITLPEPTNEQVANAKTLLTKKYSTKYYNGDKLNQQEKDIVNNARQKFNNHEIENILMALNKVPDSHLEKIRNLKFGKRPYALIGNQLNKPEAQYIAAEHTTLIIEANINDQDLYYGDVGTIFSTRFQHSVIHETGHAVDYNSGYNQGLEKYKTIKNNLSKAIEALKEANSEDSDYLSIKDNYSEAIEAFKNLSPFTMLSGKIKTPYVKDKYGIETNSSPTPFTTASKLDDYEISWYGSKNNEEAFAESYALYITAPKTLEALSPNLYQYFETL